MTILQLLESQNMATACRTQNTYETVAGNQEAGTTGAIAVNKNQLQSFETVCYSPVNGIILIGMVVSIFMMFTLMIKKFTSK